MTALILQNAKPNYSVKEQMKGFENLQDFIETKIQRKEKFFIGRLSGTETKFCGGALCGKNINPMLQTMAQNAGIFISSKERLSCVVGLILISDEYSFPFESCEAFSAIHL